MNLSIVIVSWNVRDKLRENLKALFESKGDFEFEVFVVDNNSHDKSAEMVRNEFPQVKLIANQENLGFAKANNQAIKKAKGEFILLLNPDMKVFPDTLINMLKWMYKNKQASVAGCHLVTEAGKTVKHVRKFPKISDQLAIALKIPHLFSRVLNKYLYVDFDYANAQEVDSVRGGFFFMRNRKLLDEQYFIWFEEVDYCKQIKKVNGQVWYTPTAKCIDYVGQSFKQVKRGQAQKYFRDSQLKYFKKWHPIWQYWLLKLAWPVGLMITWIGGRLKVKRKAKT